MTYEEYLKTAWWQGIKKKVYKKYNGHCSKCFTTKNLETHHLKYKDKDGSIWFREKLTDLQLLCHTCHYSTHRMKKGWKNLRPSDVIHFIWITLVIAYSVPNRSNRRRGLFY